MSYSSALKNFLYSGRGGGGGGEFFGVAAPPTAEYHAALPAYLPL